MSQETLGYVKLEWICLRCKSRVPGPEKTCLNCGAPQPENVQFVEALGEIAVLDKDLEQIAEKGPDIHCPFCGTRNPADALVCSQCGGDLKQGIRRETGKVIGAYSAKPRVQIACPQCGAENPMDAKSCSQCGAPLTQAVEIQKPAYTPEAQISQRTNKLTIGIAVVLVVLCLAGIFAFFALSAPSATQNAQVASVGWQTAVEVLELRPVTRNNWEDEIPRDAPINRCVDRVYQISNSEPSGEKFNKICGTPYTIDTGTGVGQVVQDCRYEILRPFCEYVAEEWRVVENVEMSGEDLNPVFANPNLSSDQQLGEMLSEYWVIFETSEGQYTYRIRDQEEFRQYRVGSEWLLQLNALDQILSIEKAD